MDKLMELVMKLWGQTDSSLLTKGLIILCLLTVSLFALSKIVDGAAKLVQLIADGAKAAVARHAGGRQRIAWLNRKHQFLSVLASDLGAIGKAEAWNDQHFTDLEAEVEIEGRYYASPLWRLLRKKSTGRRKESSLIKAIDSSSEKCLVLVGDPGAGKSVALRHLALRLIERSKKSTSEMASVPLYINLRELSIGHDQPATADFIKDFVIDNVRRGDVETAEYIKENWRDFKERGIWFFLFDSFDEIPEVMHAAAGDHAVRKYSNAIRSFMDGLGACRSVLASREYKSPTSLIWPKLRILPLSESLQERLVRRTFLSDDQKEKVLLHISRSVSATYKNPLFLTLLCKYVKTHNAAPVNEHELLFNHVKSLTRRDDDYIGRTWLLSPEDLWTGACDLAKLLATSSRLSLAPTVAEIIDAARSGGLTASLDKIEPLIEALTYVKIGRTDVASSDATVRRFAFSHRRYQESLFASYLLDHPDEISYEDLIVDPRWREYLVALLQIAGPAYVESVVRFAAAYLDKHILSLRPVLGRYYGVPIQSYNWNDEKLGHILGLFLEAKLYLPEGPWESLQGPVEKLFGSAWRKGDYLDRLQVLRFCGVGSPELSVRRVESAIRAGIPAIEEAALVACRFIVFPKSDLASWVRRQVGARMVGSSRKFEVLRWEAIASELPEQFAIGVVIARAKSLYKFSAAIRSVLTIKKFVDSMIGGEVAVKDQSSGQMLSSRRGLAFVTFWLCYLLALVINADVALAMKGSGHVRWVGFSILVGMTFILAATMIRLACLSEPATLNPRRVVDVGWRALQAFTSRLRIFVLVFAISSAALSLPGIVVYAVCRWLGLLQEKGFELVVLGSVGFYALALPIVIGIGRLSDRRARRAASTLLVGGTSFKAAVASARSSREFVAVCQIVDGSDDKTLRSAISLSSALVKLASQTTSTQAPPWLSRASSSDIRHALAALLAKADRTSRSIF